MDESSRNKRIIKKIISHMSVAIGTSIVTTLIGKILNVSIQNTWLGAIGASVFLFVFFKMLLDIARILKKREQEKSIKADHMKFIPFSKEMCIVYLIYFAVFCGILGSLLGIITAIATGEITL